MFNSDPHQDRAIRQTRRLTFVPRWVVVPTIRKQTVDQHSYQVAQIARWLLQFHYNPSTVFRLEVVEYALDHDADEALTGDKPTPSKEPTEAGGSQIHVIVKCADVLEAICFLEEEAAMGNFAYTNSILMERRAVFHDWWQHFDWLDGADPRNTKPLSSDIIRYLVQQFVRPVHPAMEPKE